MLKNLSADARDTRGMGSIPRQDREEETWGRKWQPTPALAWEIPWTEEPGGLQSMVIHTVDLNTKLRGLVARVGHKIPCPSATVTHASTRSSVLRVPFLRQIPR